MNNEDLQHHMKFSARLAREFPLVPIHHISLLASRLCRLGRRHSHLAVHLCNHGLSEQQQKVYDRIDEDLRKLFLEFMTPGDLPDFITGGDPRGCVIKLKFESGATDDFGQTGICVPGA